MADPVLIGITGKAFSGKDTAFSLIEEWAEERGVRAVRRAFADNIKLSFARLFIPDISREEALVWCDRLKANGAIRLDDVRDVNEQRTTLSEEITVRLALQRYGTECHRNLFGLDFWIDQLLPLDDEDGNNWLGNFWYGFGVEWPQICVVTDVRFNDEALRVIDLGGMNLRIRRKSNEPDEDSHVSEHGISDGLVDFTINNNGTIDNLRTSVHDWLDARVADRLVFRD